MFADVIVDISVEALDRTFQYRIPKEMEAKIVAGSRVIIPFGKNNREIAGYVIEVTDVAKWPEEKMKSLLSVDEKEVSVEGQLLQLAAWIRNQYGATMNEALKTVLPVRRQIKSVEEHWLNFVVSEEEAKKEWERCRLKHYKAKERLLYGMFAEKGEMTTKTAANKYKVTKSVIDGMVRSGIIAVHTQRKYRNPYEIGEKSNSGILLNEEQRKAVFAFANDWEKGIYKTYLLYGVTGSGKTEVYQEMIARVVEKGKQVIVLIPEIALTYQTVRRFGERFGNRVSILNSRMSEGERYDQYERVRRGEVDIMVGPRSALFAPFSNLGLIIVDEEHENSYKSEKPPKYHGREVAIRRAEMAGASVVLGSATPSTDSYYAVKKGTYELLRLNQRAGEAKKPEVHIVDLKEELQAGNRSVFSRVLQNKIQERLQRGEQTMLFLNRRGYAGFVSCRSCGSVLQCPHCEISMTAHKDRGNNPDTLICHYCGHSISMPGRCPTCGSPYIAAFGLGTQKVEEMLRKQFPQARILRMDGDTTTGKQGHEKVLQPFREGKADILVGTQMIAKGHDFPNVTLVAALAADMSMYAGDYRSTERTFQLLMQVSGRAGRADKPGEVIIQTYNPEEYVIKAVKEQNPDYFYENELAYRRLTKYPPYTIMVAVLVTAEREEDACQCIQALSQRLQMFSPDKMTLVGPSKAGLSRAKDRFRYVLYVKCQDEESVRIVRNETEWVTHDNKWEKSCIVQLDRDPVSGY